MGSAPGIFLVLGLVIVFLVLGLILIFSTKNEPGGEAKDETKESGKKTA